jgi:hypothetical protein
MTTPARPPAFQLGLHGLAPLQVVEILEEKNPRGLFGVVQLGGAAGLFSEDVVDVLEGLFKHGAILLVVAGDRAACRRVGKSRGVCQ